MEKIIYRETIPGLTVERLQRDETFVMPYQHIHDRHYEIYYLFSGERRYLVETRTYHLRPGSLLFLNRSRIHKSAPIGEPFHDRFLMEADAGYFKKLFSSYGELPLEFFREDCIVLHFEGEERTALEDLLFRLSVELKDKKEGYLLMVSALLTQLLVAILRLDAAAMKEPVQNGRTQLRKQRLVEDITGYIIEHFREPLSLAGISARFYMNKCYLSRIFKEESGLTVSEYIHLQRVRHACALLEQSHKRISEISEECGFETITYFERVFKKYTGLSPLHYRRQAP